MTAATAAVVAIRFFVKWRFHPEEPCPPAAGADVVAGATGAGMGTGAAVHPGGVHGDAAVRSGWLAM